MTGTCSVCRRPDQPVRPDTRTGEILACVDEQACFTAYRALAERIVGSSRRPRPSRLISPERAAALKAADEALDLAFGRAT